MVRGRGADPVRQTRRPTPRGRCAGGPQRHHVRAEHRLSVALHPKDLPPRSTVYGYLQRWTYDGTLSEIHHTLYQKCREQVDRKASPTACIIDSQSVKSAEKGGPASIPMDMMQGRKSVARSAIFWSPGHHHATRSPTRYGHHRRDETVPPSRTHSVWRLRQRQSDGAQEEGRRPYALGGERSWFSRSTRASTAQTSTVCLKL
jgi:hypothetical protein